MNTELKPCHFCGEKVYLEKEPLWDPHSGVAQGYVGEYRYFIKCPKCGCTLTGSEYIIKQWNGEEIG